MLTSRLAVIALVAVAITGCTGDQNTRATSSPPASQAYVVRSGFSVRGDRIGMGAIVRVRGNRTIRDIELSIAFTADGEKVTVEPDTLPFCPPSTDCYWGQGFYPDEEDPDPRTIDRIEVAVARDGGSRPEAGEVIELETETRNGVSVTPRKQEGTVYLVAIRDRVPVFGVSFFTGRDDTRPLHYAEPLFALRDGDDVRAFFYPGPVPESVYGPTD